MPNDVKPENANVGVVMVPIPETKVHNPVPITGVFPASVKKLAQIVCEVPALEIVGFASCVIATVELELGQTPFEIVH